MSVNVEKIEDKVVITLEGDHVDYLEIARFSQGIKDYESLIMFLIGIADTRAGEFLAYVDRNDKIKLLLPEDECLEEISPELKLILDKMDNGENFIPNLTSINLGEFNSFVRRAYKSNHDLKFKPIVKIDPNVGDDKL